MEKYSYPPFDLDSIIYDPALWHWINFFGGEGLYTLQDRIAHVLKINESVFQDKDRFAQEIMTIISEANHKGIYISRYIAFIGSGSIVETDYALHTK